MSGMGVYGGPHGLGGGEKEKRGAAIPEACACRSPTGNAAVAGTHCILHSRMLVAPCCRPPYVNCAGVTIGAPEIIPSP